GPHEPSQIMKSILPDQLFRDTDTCGGYQEVKSALLSDSALDGGRHLRGVSDVSPGEGNVRAEFLGQSFATGFIHVSDCDLCAARGQHAHGSRSQTGSPAGDQSACALNVHA